MQRFYPPRGKSGHKRCVEVSGCEAPQVEATGVVVGFDRALHNYRLHPVNNVPNFFIAKPTTCTHPCTHGMALISLPLASPV